MSRNSKPPFIPPLKLTVSENAVSVRGRPQNVRHAAAADDVPDPQAGGESSRQERTTHSSADKTDEPQGKSTASCRTEELDKQKTAEVQKGAAVDRSELEHSPTRGDKHVREAKSKTTSRVRELITQFDRTTSSRSSKLPKRNGKIPPRDDSDVETSLLDAASDGNDGSISDLLQSEEMNENSKMHTRQFQQTEENEMSMELRQPSATQQPSAKVVHHRSRGTGLKSRLGSVESPSKERRSRSRKGPDSPHSFVSNASSPVRSVATVETYQVSQQSRLPVFKPETRTQTVMEAFAGSQRTSHADYSPRQTSLTRSTQIQARWDGSPSKGGLIGAPDESGLSSSRSRASSDESGRSTSRSRAHRKVIKEVTNPPCDKVTELRCADQTPDGQDPIASFIIHESLLEPPCRATNRPVFEPRGWAIVREERHLSDHQVSNGHSVTVKLRQVLSYFLSLLLAIPVQVFTFAATWIVRLLRCLTVSNWIRVISDLCSCPPPSSPEDQAGMWNRIRTGLHNRRRPIIQLLIVLVCCYAFLFFDFCTCQ